MKKIHLITLGILSGVLFALGWPLRGFPALLFIAFIPMLFVDDYLIKHKKDNNCFSIFFMLYPGFFIFNLFTVYWIWNSTISGGIGALFLNSFFLTTAFTLYHISRRQLYNYNKGNFLLLFFWLAFEYFHLDWELSFPWLNLGNGFGEWYRWIQWYEYTGALGGTLWIVLINLLIYKLILRVKENKIFKRIEYIHASGILLLIIVPIIISLNIYANYEEKDDPIDVVVVQPNLDPYSEQYDMDSRKIIQRILDLINPFMDNKVDYIVCPESANQENMFEDRLSQYSSNQMIQNNILQKYPESKFIIGASTFKLVYGKDTLSNATRYFTNSKAHYWAFNTAMYFEQNDLIQLYHKSKLTPGVEKMPSWRILRPLEKLAINLGGTIGTLATDDLRKNFVSKDSTKIATVICYESIYGEFVSHSVKNGAQVIFIITNDGWWGNTPGYKQHFSMAKIRAIENRRAIARSANTGTSCFINQRGDVSQPTAYWVKDVIREKINLNNELTFYTKNGDYIARISSLITVFFMLLAISLGIKNRKKKI
jgi:apolipoprotein N-acyltransferase